jgi:hypothetical protein
MATRSDRSMFRARIFSVSAAINIPVAQIERQILRYNRPVSQHVNVLAEHHPALWFLSCRLTPGFFFRFLRRFLFFGTHGWLFLCLFV